MRKSLITTLLAVFTFTSVARAEITNVVYDPTPAGSAVICPYYYWYDSSDTMHMYGTQYWGPGYMNGTIYTDTEVDPTLTILNSLENDTSFTWTGFHVNVFMNVNFVLSAANVTTPADWTSVITSQPVWNGSQYVGQVDYYSGTPVAIGGTLEFGYKMTFDGALSYTFTQELIPVPEPTTGALASLALLMFGFTRRYLRR